MRVGEFMSTDVETISPEASGADAWEMMRRRRIRHLVVVRGKSVVGILSDRDLGGRIGDSARAGRTVAEMMTPSVATASAATSVRQAANLLRGRTIGSLPVLDGTKLVGIVTTSDLLELLGRGAEMPNPRARRAILTRRGPRRPAHSGS